MLCATRVYSFECTKFISGASSLPCCQHCLELILDASVFLTRVHFHVSSHCFHVHLLCVWVFFFHLTKISHRLYMCLGFFPRRLLFLRSSSFLSFHCFFFFKSFYGLSVKLCVQVGGIRGMWTIAMPLSKIQPFSMFHRNISILLGAGALCVCVCIFCCRFSLRLKNNKHIAKHHLGFRCVFIAFLLTEHISDHFLSPSLWSCLISLKSSSISHVVKLYL